MSQFSRCWLSVVHSLPVSTAKWDTSTGEAIINFELEASTERTVLTIKTVNKIELRWGRES